MEPAPDCGGHFALCFATFPTERRKVVRKIKQLQRQIQELNSSRGEPLEEGSPEEVEQRVGALEKQLHEWHIKLLYIRVRMWVFLSQYRTLGGECFERDYQPLKAGASVQHYPMSCKYISLFKRRPDEDSWTRSHRLQVLQKARDILCAKMESLGGEFPELEGEDLLEEETAPETSTAPSTSASKKVANKRTGTSERAETEAVRDAETEECEAQEKADPARMSLAALAAKDALPQCVVSPCAAEVTAASSLESLHSILGVWSFFVLSSVSQSFPKTASTGGGGKEGSKRGTQGRTFATVPTRGTRGRITATERYIVSAVRTHFRHWLRHLRTPQSLTLTPHGTLLEDTLHSLCIDTVIRS